MVRKLSAAPNRYGTVIGPQVTSTRDVKMIETSHATPEEENRQGAA